MKELIQASIRESLSLKERFFAENLERLVRVGDVLIEALRHGHKIFLFGNGGSAADAQHIAAELVNHFEVTRRGLPALALTTDASALTSIGNDLGFEQIFSRQIEALGQAGDVAIGISTSGRSPNVVRALESAKSMGLVTVGLTGRDGGPIAAQVDYTINVPHASTARVQEVHGMIGHILSLVIDQAFSAGERSLTSPRLK
ncbi:MAG: D-sedoheptulose 7-phosphate isomerase [Acidobacteria bacterium]|nr:D-sedoheptulose 7-phosphate isomerase [Acidobacteriota bacterium]MBI3657819.1 D-sedoheptulose 7-phosphate isomerase [Acidobacteriota bacterium]